MSGRFRGGALVRLDGGVATELHRAGVPISAPWWTTRALLAETGRSRLRRVHERYLEAGAQVITANTLRCNLRALRRAGLGREGSARMVHTAVRIAVDARTETGRHRARVAGSISPVEDCYRPGLVPPDVALHREHRWLASELVSAGADIVLVETMNTVREALIALEQVQAAGGRAWVSFVCTDGARLLSGEPVSDAARVVERAGAQAVLVNCTSLRRTRVCLAELASCCSGPIGAYPNIEDRRDTAATGHVDHAIRPVVGPAEFADALAGWRDEFGVSMLGGCCGTTPAHLAELFTITDSMPFTVDDQSPTGRR